MLACQAIGVVVIEPRKGQQQINDPSFTPSDYNRYSGRQNHCIPPDALTKTALLTNYRPGIRRTACSRR